MSSTEAAAAARRSFGGVDQIKEQYRDRRGIPFVEVTIQDFRYSLRLILRRPWTYILLILIFALGIGVNTAVYSIVDGVLVRPLPYSSPDDLVRVWSLGVRRWCWRAGRIGVHDIVSRSGLFSANRTDVDVSMPLEDADIRVRLAGLDLDPGWLPWFGRVVRFHYLYRGELYG